MSNVQALKVPQKTLNIGGRERSIKFDLNAFAEIEVRYGSVEKAFIAFEKGEIKAVRTLLWAGLIHDEAVLDPETGDLVKYNITPFQVGSWLDLDKLDQITSQVMDAMGDSVPAENEGPSKNV
jgi:hypothetical protein